jgi:hypothetical protein
MLRYHEWGGPHRAPVPQSRHKWRCDIRLSTTDSGWRGLLDNREIIGEAARTTVLVKYSIIRSSNIQNRQTTTTPPPPLTLFA